jgi:alkanesulfonate monooxygenase SsuD/methylene tetrahydromethanopterin reductase-like flavin-dependent oxidoreductase (luciferase family)
VDAAYVADHLTHPTLPDVFIADGWTTLAAASQATSRIDLGTLVGAAGFRSPLTLARAAATLQDVSGGRFVFGLGAGTPLDVLAATGSEPTTAELSRRFCDTVEDLDRIFRGVQVDVHSLPVSPGSTRPFLMLAAHGPRGFALVARHADGWSTYGGHAATDLDAGAWWPHVTRQRAAVDEACQRIGRDPAALRRSLLLGYGTMRPLSSVAAFAECLERAEEGGFDEVVVYWPRGGQGTRFWADPSVVAECLAVPRGR